MKPHCCRLHSQSYHGLGTPTPSCCWAGDPGQALGPGDQLASAQLLSASPSDEPQNEDPDRVHQDPCRRLGPSPQRLPRKHLLREVIKHLRSCAQNARPARGRLTPGEGRQETQPGRCLGASRMGAPGLSSACGACESPGGLHVWPPHGTRACGCLLPWSAALGFIAPKSQPWKIPQM